MGRFVMAIWVILSIAVVFMGYIRLAPSNPADWHAAPDVTQDENLINGVKRVIPGDAKLFAQLDAIARSTPRTTVLAGSVDDGMITYVTRTRVMGFPDYTTVMFGEDQIKIFARLRFGRSDLGVNRNRTEEWLSQLERVNGGG